MVHKLKSWEQVPIVLTKYITLHSVLHVPSLDCNLLSVSKLNHNLNCITQFYPNLCEFQEVGSMRTIGSARLCSGLYILQLHPPRMFNLCSASKSTFESSHHQLLSSSVNKDDSEVMLWHYRLGHVNFIYLEKMCPSLFVNRIPSSFCCEICQFVKHSCNYFT